MVVTTIPKQLIIVNPTIEDCIIVKGLLTNKCYHEFGVFYDITTPRDDVFKLLEIINERVASNTKYNGYLPRVTLYDGILSYDKDNTTEEMKILNNLIKIGMDTELGEFKAIRTHILGMHDYMAFFKTHNRTQLNAFSVIYKNGLNHPHFIFNYKYPWEKSDEGNINN